MCDGRDAFRPRKRQQTLLPTEELPRAKAQIITLVDTESQAILDVHCTTEKCHDTQLGWQLARRTRASCTASLPTKVTIGSNYAIG